MNAASRFHHTVRDPKIVRPHIFLSCVGLLLAIDSHAINTGRTDKDRGTADRTSILPILPRNYMPLPTLTLVRAFRCTTPPNVFLRFSLLCTRTHAANIPSESSCPNLHAFTIPLLISPYTHPRYKRAYVHVCTPSGADTVLTWMPRGVVHTPRSNACTSTNKRKKFARDDTIQLAFYRVHTRCAYPIFKS